MISRHQFDWSPPDADFGLEFFHNPIRMELADGGHIAYGEQALTANGITLKPDIEHHNFSIVDARTPLGYIDPESMQYLSARTTRGENHLHRYFHSVDGVFYPKQPLKLFMVTTNPIIARSDCLFYLVPLPELSA